jgi:hypothetical protein
MFKTGLALGFAAGYVLGAKAGRERYQQLMDAARAFSDNPGVQRLTNEVSKTVNMGRERATTAATKTAERAGNRLAEATGRTSSQPSEPVTGNGRDVP